MTLFYFCRKLLDTQYIVVQPNLIDIRKYVLLWIYIFV